MMDSYNKNSKRSSSSLTIESNSSGNKSSFCIHDASGKYITPDFQMQKATAEFGDAFLNQAGFAASGAVNMTAGTMINQTMAGTTGNAVAPLKDNHGLMAF